MTDNYQEWVGLPVIKDSRKPFKSGKVCQVATGLTTNPFTGRPAFKFMDDDSVVECRMVKPLKNFPV